MYRWAFIMVTTNEAEIIEIVKCEIVPLSEKATFFCLICALERDLECVKAMNSAFGAAVMESPCSF